MPLLSSCYLPGIYAEDHSIDVPLDWRGTSPAALAGAEQDEPSALAMEGAAERPDSAFVGKSIKLFYRELCSPATVGRDLPLIVFFQGGPGGACPRPLSPQSDGWIEEALRHFRVVLPDQRGCGRSSRVDGARIAAVGAEAAAQGADPARRQAEYLKRFLADSIIRDFEYLRLTEFGGRKWVTLGQSYGGFLTLANLSAFPGGSCRELYLRRHPPCAGKRRRGLCAHVPAHGRQDSGLLRALPRGRDARLPCGRPSRRR